MFDKMRYNTDIMSVFLVVRIKGEEKGQESIHTSTTPDPRHTIIMGKWQNTRTHHKQESQEVSPFSASDYKAAMHRQGSIKDKRET